MMELTSEQIFELLEKYSVMGFVSGVLSNTIKVTDNAVPRQEEQYLKIKEHLKALPEGEIEKDALCDQIEEILSHDETVMVLFKKDKHNGKVGVRKTFPKGCCYYIGTDPKHLTKVYIHWKEEKMFLLQNIRSLKSKNLMVSKFAIDIIENVFCMNISMQGADSPEERAEINIYIGYSR